MASKTRAQKDAGRASAILAVRKRPAAPTPPASRAGESPSPDVRPVPPPGVVSGSAEDLGGGKGAGKGNVSRKRGSPVACGICSREGKRFKMESVWDCDAQDPEVGEWLHTCAECIMAREDLSTLQAAQAWIFDTARAVTSVPPECMSRVARAFCNYRVRPACASLFPPGCSARDCRLQ